MRKPGSKRIDYTPGPGAQAVLDELLATSGRTLGKQALLDKLVIWGAWCAKKEQDRPPPLFGANRARWKR